MLLGATLAIVTACPVYAESRSYGFYPNGYESSLGTSYKFHVDAMKGRVTSAELVVSPAALPIWNNYPDVYGGESNSPLLSDQSHSSYYIGKRFISPNILFNQYWSLDVTEFMRTVRSPYAMISISDGRFTQGASLIVTTFVPEPSSRP